MHPTPWASSRCSASGQRPRCCSTRLASSSERLRASVGLLESYSYPSVLARGFALVRDLDGHPVTNVKTALAKSDLDLEFADGRARVAVTEKRSTSSKRGTGKRRPDDGNQGRLL